MNILLFLLRTWLILRHEEGHLEIPLLRISRSLLHPQCMKMMNALLFLPYFGISPLLQLKQLESLHHISLLFLYVSFQCQHSFGAENAS
jgi:hypothetical protein